ncbi:hypothetical protein [Flavobacterium sp. GCM10027622]|uniref:hypothetical protein n=1 Tax=unclassified Flavobacterium TaxID=196869 RepID=UPI00360BE2FE
MKKIIILILTVFTLNVYSQEINTEDWITDLNFLKSELSKKHKNLFSKLSKDEFDSGIDKIIKQLDKDTDIQTSIKLHQLIAKIGDSHTSLSTSHITQKRKIIPIDFMWLKEGLFISGSTKDNYELLDKKLLAINGFKINTIIDSLNTLSVVENNALIKTTSSRLLDSNVLLKHFGFSKPNDSIYNLELSDINGTISQHKIIQINSDMNNRKNMAYMKVNAETPFYRNGSGNNFKEQYFAKEKIYYIQYNKCVSRESIEKYGDKETAYKYPSFKEFEEKVLKTLENSEIDKLIFDMRFNGGGSSYLAESLIDKIAANKKINKKGKLFVVVGNNTFSSAIFNTIYFKKKTQAIIIGEETGGKPNHFGYVKSFSLPYSEIKVRYSSEFWKLTEDNDASIVPDITIETSYNDFKNGIDPVFEYVKKN